MKAVLVESWMSKRTNPWSSRLGLQHPLRFTWRNLEGVGGGYLREDCINYEVTQWHRFHCMRYSTIKSFLTVRPSNEGFVLSYPHKERSDWDWNKIHRHTGTVLLAMTKTSQVQLHQLSILTLEERQLSTETITKFHISSLAMSDRNTITRIRHDLRI